MTEEKKIGRPEEYTEEKSIKICDLIACGMPIRQICSQDGMPGVNTLFTWLYKHKEFQDRYARARTAQMEYYATELMEIVDNASLTAESINKARLQADTRKWLMSKLKSPVYGDNAMLTHTGKVDIEQLIIQRTPKTIDHQPAVKELPVIDVKPE